MVTLDSYDWKILRVLRSEGRIANNDLAEKIGLSTTPCWNRVKRLTENGIISGYHATINWAKLGRPDKAIVDITLTDHSGNALDKFCMKMMEDEWVLSARIITGDIDIEVTVIVDGMLGLDEFLRRQLYSNPIVRTIRTKFVIGEHVRS